MRIISKYKDYYDYYQGIFGMDNSKVYDRRKMITFDTMEVFNTIDATILDFYICGTQYRMLLFKGILYHTPDELEELDKILDDEGNRGLYLKSWGLKSNENKYQAEYDGTNNIPVDVNTKLREPILLKFGRHDDFFQIPLLSDFNFHKIMDAKDVYIKVETFLGWMVDNPPLPNTQTNDGKIQTAGFDKKHSFRPNMKK